MVSRKVLVALVAVVILAAAGFAYYYITHPSPQRVLETSHRTNAKIKSLAAIIYVFRGAGENATPIAVEKYTYFSPDTVMISRGNYSIIRVGENVFYLINNKTYVLTSKPPFPILPVTDPLNFEKVGELKGSKVEDNHYVIDIMNMTTGVEYIVYVNRTTNLLDKVVVSFPVGVKITYVVKVVATQFKRPNLQKILKNAIPVNATELYRILDSLNQPSSANNTSYLNTSYSYSPSYNSTSYLYNTSTSNSTSRKG